MGSGARPSGFDPGRGLAGGEILLAIRAIRAGRALLSCRRDPDLAWLDGFSLRDLELQDSVLEPGSCLVRLDAGRQGDGAAQCAAADLLHQALAVTLLTLGLGLRVDAE